MTYRVLEDYLAHLEERPNRFGRNVSPATIRAARADLHGFIAWWEQRHHSRQYSPSGAGFSQRIGSVAEWMLRHECVVDILIEPTASPMLRAKSGSSSIESCPAAGCAFFDDRDFFDAPPAFNPATRVPMSALPQRRWWLRNESGLPFAAVASYSESLARSTASGLRSTP
jgi:hypothetical protein